MTDSKKIKILSQTQSSQLIQIKRELEEAQSFDPFLAFDQKSKVITDFTSFSAAINRTLRVYEELKFILSRIQKNEKSEENEDQSTQDQKIVEPSSNDLFFKLLDTRNNYHFQTYEKPQFRISGVFNLVEEYLDRLNSDPYQESSRALLSKNLERLSSLANNSKPQAEKVGEVEEEFRRIKRILEKDIDLKIKTVVLTKREPKLDQTKVAKRDKAIMVDQIHLSLIKQLKKPKFLEKVDLKDIQIQIQDNEVASDFMSQSTGNFVFISYSKENSFLATSDGEGLSLIKEGQDVYSKQFLEGSMNYLMEIVSCKGSYFLYNYNPGRILRKNQNESDPTVWWEKKKIEKFDHYNKIIRTIPDDSGVVINVSDTELFVVEVKDDGTPGREVVIKNETGRKINCHEPLADSRILTVNRNGLIVVYQIDLDEFGGYEEVERLQIELKAERKENCFFMSICEKSERAAILIWNKNSSHKASRIRLYDLTNKYGEKNLEFKTELDLWERELTYFCSICFSHYIGDKLMIFGFSKDSDKNSKRNLVHTFYYDVSKNELDHKESKDLGGEGKNCWKLQRFGDYVYGIQRGGKIIKCQASLYN